MATDLENKIIGALRTVRDPEIPFNICDLGLIYELKVEPSGAVAVKMTLTAPNCPVAAEMPGQVERAVRSVPGVTDVKVELVWEPPWNQSKLSPAALIQLGLM